MPGPPTPSRSSSFASADTSTSSNNAALLGAATAFARPTHAPVILRNTYSGTDGARAAATTAGAVSKSPSPHRGRTRSPLSVAGSPGKSTITPVPQGMAAMSNVKSNGPNLLVPQPERPSNTRSHSYQAAAVAAARAPPPSTPPVVIQERSPRARSKTMQRPSIAPKPRRLSDRYIVVKANKEKPTDTTSISSTSSLVNLFEQRVKSAASPRNDRPAPIIVRPSHELAITSPKPLKPSEGITSVFHIELDGVEDSHASGTHHQHEKDDPHALEDSDRHVFRGPSVQATKDQYTSRSSPVPVPKRYTPIKHAGTAVPIRPMTASEPKQQPHSPPPLRSATALSNAISIKPPSRASTSLSESMAGSAQSPKTISGQYNHLYAPKRQIPMMSGDELANAMVASSLASSRAHSPTRLEPPAPPVPTRKKKSHHHHHSMLPSFSRTPSPAKTGMLHTLRQHDSSEEEDEGNHPYGKHRKKRLVRKHPNKHHEGDRKRWRDAVTERERRRYEGVWAANKGLHCVFTVDEEAYLSRLKSVKQQRRGEEHPRASELRATVAEQVSSVVVRDIWNRSRLPEAVLEMVWDLVDNGNVGRLHKEEFVVGLWLIDQRLKGRKLPVKVTDSVWASVRGLQGIKIRKA